MRLIHRFTRDDISAWVWWPLAIGLTALALLTIPGEHRAVDRARFAVAAGAVEVADRVLSPLLDRAGPISGRLDDATAHAFRDAIRDQVLTDPRVDVVRLWAPDGRMLWSSVARAPLGTRNAVNDGELADAAASPRVPVQFVSDRALDGSLGAPTLQTYVGLGEGDRAVAVVQFETAPDDSLVAPTQELWAGYRIVLGAAAGFVLVLALLSLRAPVAPVGAGVPFFPESVPRGMAVLDADRVRELEAAAALARARIARIGVKLEESERERQRLVSEVQRILAEHGARPMTRGEPAAGRRDSGAPSDGMVVLPDPETPQSGRQRPRPSGGRAQADPADPSPGTGAGANGARGERDPTSWR